MVKKGNALIATPSVIGDLYFHRSVIFMIENDNKNSMGFIINRRLDFKLNEVVNDLKYLFPLYYGGPVEPDNLFFIYKSKIIVSGSRSITKNIKYGGDFNEIIQLINGDKITKSDIKFFLGYSGWTESQIKVELKNKNWELISYLDCKIIFSNYTKNIWKKNLTRINKKYQLWINTPDNPNHN